MTVTRYPVGLGAVPGQQTQSAFRLLLDAESSEVGDEDLTKPGTSVPILVRAQIMQLPPGPPRRPKTLSEREVITAWRTPAN
jgi:hypothetical protein